MILESTLSLNRVVSLWNSLPDGVNMDSDIINCFRSRLDKFWTIDQDVVYKWEADLGSETKFMFVTTFFLFCLDEEAGCHIDRGLATSVNFR